MFLAKVVPLVFLSVSGVWAQFDMAQCQTGFEWNRNSLGQDPCTVGSMLDASCRSLVVYSYPPLNASQYYLPPRADHSGDLDCDCNTVMYNLYMACASCQSGQIYSWTAWIAACQVLAVARYPKTLPQGTAVPHWAYFNVTSATNQTYDQATMIALGPNPEETPPPASTLSISSTSRTSSGTGTSTALPVPTSDSSNNGPNVAAIVGGVVGSIVPLTILAVVAFFYMRHRRQQQAQPKMLNQDGMDSYEQRPTSMYGPGYTSAPFTTYNPSDPTTFPPQSPQSSVTYTTPIHPTRGTYSGAPEV